MVKVEEELVLLVKQFLAHMDNLLMSNRISRNEYDELTREKIKFLNKIEQTVEIQ
jgi:hypothetical protein